MTRTRAVRLLVVGLVLITAVGSASCTADDKAKATDFFFAWVSQAEGGTLGAIAAIGLSKSDDPTIDAILKAKKVLDDLGKADGKAEEAETALTAGNYDKAEQLIREAIAIRPQDYSYRNKLAALQIEKGQPLESLVGYDRTAHDAMTAKQQLAAYNSAVYEYGAARERIRAWPPEKRGPDDSYMYEVDKKLVERLVAGHKARAATYEKLGLNEEANEAYELARQYESYNP